MRKISESIFTDLLLKEFSIEIPDKEADKIHSSEHPRQP